MCPERGELGRGTRGGSQHRSQFRALSLIREKQLGRKQQACSPAGPATQLGTTFTSYLQF